MDGDNWYCCGWCVVMVTHSAVFQSHYLSFWSVVVQYALFITCCDHCSLLVIIIHVEWSLFTHFGHQMYQNKSNGQVLNNPLLPTIQELFTDQRHWSDIFKEIQEMMTSRSKGKERNSHSPSPGSMRAGTIPPSLFSKLTSNNIVCLYVLDEHNVL